MLRYLLLARSYDLIGYKLTKLIDAVNYHTSLDSPTSSEKQIVTTAIAIGVSLP